MMLPFLYGYHPKPVEESDPIVTGAEHGMEVFDRVTKFGAFLVDIIPACERITMFAP